MYQVTKNIKFTRVQLLDWANRQREHTQGKFVTTEDKLKSSSRQLFTNIVIAQGQELYTQIHFMLAQEKVLLRQ